MAWLVRRHLPWKKITRSDTKENTPPPSSVDILTSPPSPKRRLQRHSSDAVNLGLNQKKNTTTINNDNTNIININNDNNTNTNINNNNDGTMNKKIQPQQKTRSPQQQKHQQQQPPRPMLARRNSVSSFVSFSGLASVDLKAWASKAKKQEAQEDMGEFALTQEEMKEMFLGEWDHERNVRPWCDTSQGDDGSFVTLLKKV